ncbi:hypothetical protein DSO57_1028315 [Entomophthora muscae]|uniref:Uncharacterized protein n=1 Tax=Entomophthora muscae TaxID=34485 RepID=A0ACC2TZF2_9FUNG|nr:hypothetical protein DSO57_1028315 [Entomophthora muscae]
MDQYKAAVKNELNEDAKNSSEWNPYVKKTETPVSKNKVTEEVVKYVKAFMAQNVTTKQRGPPSVTTVAPKGTFQLTVPKHVQSVENLIWELNAQYARKELTVACKSNNGDVIKHQTK